MTVPAEPPGEDPPSPPPANPPPANPPPGGPAGPPRRRAGLAALAAPVMLAVAVQSLANLVFHAVVGRRLGPDSYGALGSLLAAITLVAVPLSALQTAAARTTAAAGLSRGTARHAVLRATVWLGSASLLALVASPLIGGYLRVATGEAALLAPALGISGVLAILRGMFLGVGRSPAVAASYLASAAARLALGLPLAATWGVAGALVGTLLGEALATLGLLMLAQRLAAGADVRIRAADLARTTAMLTGLFLFSTMDLFLARHLLAGEASGDYVAAATIGKTVLALPAAAISVVYPRLVAGWSNRSGGVLRSGLLVVGLPALAGGLLIAAVPRQVLQMLYGDTYLTAATLTSLLAINAALTAFVNTLAHAALARSSLLAQGIWVAVLVQYGAISALGSSPLRIGLTSLAATLTMTLLLAAAEIPAWSRRRKHAR
ncbi:MAG: polysaccharide biosynthesis protein [Candidatus Nanopelagicales bacterium]